MRACVRKCVRACVRPCVSPCVCVVRACVRVRARDGIFSPSDLCSTNREADDVQVALSAERKSKAGQSKPHIGWTSTGCT